jgi:hypothetical protein
LRLLAQQQQEIHALTETLKAQAAQSQKVSEQFKAQPVVMVSN